MKDLSYNKVKILMLGETGTNIKQELESLVYCTDFLTINLKVRFLQH
jgi:hypothetical protein